MPTIIELDIDNIPLTEFMQSIGCKPVTTAGGLIAYNPPYNAGNAPTFVVNTNTNRWIDTANGKKGGIYDLAYELTGSCNRSELNLYIATQMKGIVDFKTYGVTANGEEAERNVVVAMPVSKPETPKAAAKVEPPKEQPTPEQPKQHPPKPRRKMRF